jgi:hypothetical protein
MKLSESSFQTAVKVGGLVLLVSTVGNVYLLLRHREVYRDATRVEAEFQRQSLIIALKQQALEGVLREFATHANTDLNIAAILQRYAPKPAATATKSNAAVKK